MDIKRFAKTAGLEVDTVVRTIAFDAYGAVTEKTPVDTGRAKANWNVMVGSPDTTTSDKTKASPVVLNKGDGLKDIYITNSLPYIYALENGSSEQAPAGMVAITMSEISARYK
jgi:hypothetical protein